MFYLALHLGKTVEELSESMSFKEFMLWERYFDKQPFGFVRDDIRAGRQSVQIVAPHVKNPKKLKLQDFVLEFKREKKQSIEDMMEAAKTFANRFKKGHK